ncbi:MAG: NAD(P)H-hydrate dehydratase [Nitrosomonadales bacterium]|nr:NAD(P)H-hydrate dehydratase [Nitrosomonadales bacterium]
MNKGISILARKQAMTSFPKRPRDSHKGMFGTVAVIGGAAGMVGAPLLAARAALKLGAGCVHVGLLADNAPGVDLLQPELMLHRAHDLLRPHPNPLPRAGEGANVKNNFNVLAIGCGLGTSKAAYRLLYETLKFKAPIVLDADALNLLAVHADLQDDLRARNHPSVLTPHPGEAAHLLDCKTGEVQADRAAAVRQLAQKFACSAVLKGADSLCATRDGRLFVNKTGNPGMSAAGTGDVLTGMIAAFIAQGMNADDALLLAVHLHGAAGDALAQQHAAIGMTATEVTEWARWLLNQWVGEQ